MKIGDILTGIATLYQIPNWSGVNSFILAEWIYDTYPYETLDTILRALKRPAAGKVWRLTPDIITEWMAAEIERETIKREREIHNAKMMELEEKPLTEDERLTIDQNFEKWRKSLEGDEKKVAPITDQDILREGQVRRKNDFYPSSTIEQHLEHDLKYRYGLACYDPVTGKPNASWMTFEEWKTLGNEK